MPNKPVPSLWSFIRSLPTARVNDYTDITYVLEIPLSRKAGCERHNIIIRKRYTHSKIISTKSKRANHAQFQLFSGYGVHKLFNLK